MMLNMWFMDHLANLDDTIIFVAALEKSIKRITKVMGKYEKQSGQLINKGKNAWSMDKNTSAQLGALVDRYTSISIGQFPITYLGCPITHAKKRKSNYDNLTKKVMDKLKLGRERYINL